EARSHRSRPTGNNQYRLRWRRLENAVFHQPESSGLGQPEDRRSSRATPEENLKGKKMNLRLAALLVSGALLAAGGAASAHHSFAMFDALHPKEISGTVKEFRFVSPHTILVVTVKGQDGAEKDWILEGGAPGLQVREGLTS